MNYKMPKMQVYAVRLPETAINELKEIARAQYLPPRAVVRAWIMQRLEAERVNEYPATGAAFGDNTPAAGAQHTPNGVVANDK